jgi:hypothetical protein
MLQYTINMLQYAINIRKEKHCIFCWLSVVELAIEYAQNEPRNTYHKYNI